MITISYQHGKMMEPPARNAAWRAGFHTHIDYNDNELFCGGLTVSLNLSKKKNYLTIIYDYSTKYNCRQCGTKIMVNVVFVVIRIH